MENLGFISQLIGLLEKLVHFFVPAKPKLSFEEVNARHWYNKDDSQSGLGIWMFIINRGNKVTTIRDVKITSMTPDHLKYAYPMWRNSVELPVGKDKQFSHLFFFRGDHLRYPEIKYTLKFTHSEGEEELDVVSTLESYLEPEYDSD